MGSNHSSQRIRNSAQQFLDDLRAPHSLDLVSRNANAREADLRKQLLDPAFKFHPFVGLVDVFQHRPPAEILVGFDIDSACFGYDGSEVWAAPRALIASMRQSNTIDMGRRSPSYEFRLAKYADRGYEILVPSLCRPMIRGVYYRSASDSRGLARLLVLEGIREARGGSLLEPLQYGGIREDNFQRSILHHYEQSDYDAGGCHIPYGQGWNARRICTYLEIMESKLNSSFNPASRDFLHRHLAVWGEVNVCLGGGCTTCPVPQTLQEYYQQQEDDDAGYIRGYPRFMVINPGQQGVTGSFNLIDEEDWSKDVYMAALN
ncbi:hypothetical protein CYLTODRAFT_457761 [Cylindrobasidium torrendii FP15055 ss-10]|uniref:Uncharacterized protein n=1 Tax=Cylindrobasidium torrendii FP15055 ss-10 TaxID=1314674 RepID=A0A0D7B043_9AGAR|nr:hypothetical protein CYLTODRAFT_457761 [Cylindrobasidium torrendii FP15055 ss-10]